MDIIRESTLFTTLLHCVLAYSLPSNNLPQTTEPYNMISHSFVTDILEKPSYHKELQTEATYSIVSGRNDNMAYEVKTHHDSSLKHIMKNIKQLFQPELPSTTPKGIISKYPLTTPRVKIDIAANSGLLLAKIYTSHSEKSEPTKVLESTSTDQNTKPMNAVLDDKEDLRKKTLSSKPVEYVKQEMIPLDYSTTPISQYGLESSQYDFHDTPLDKPDLSGKFLNPNFHQTNPGIYVRTEVDKPFQYTPSHSILPGLVSYPHPTHSSISGHVEPVGNNEYTSTFNPEYVKDSIKPANVDYIHTTFDMFGENVPARADEDTASYRYVPEIASKHDVPKEDNFHDGLVHSTAPNKENLAINVPKPPIDYSPTKPIGEENVALPPVPTSLTLIQRLQIALLNTVSGLPGGISGALDAVRAK